MARGAPRTVKGRYENTKLGFSVLLPRGLIGHVIEGPGCELGVKVFLDPTEFARVDIFGDGKHHAWSTPVAPCRDRHTYTRRIRV